MSESQLVDVNQTKDAPTVLQQTEARELQSTICPKPLSVDQSPEATKQQLTISTEPPTSAEESREQNVYHKTVALLCGQIRELLQRRRDLHSTEKALTLRIKAICRRVCDGDKGEAGKLYKALQGKGEHKYAVVAHALTATFFPARAIFIKERKAVEKEMVARSKELPIHDWWCSVRGLSSLGLALFVGEASGATLVTIGDYSTVAKLWKRMGLAVIGAGRQRRVTGDAALEHGYSPERRSVMWTIGSSLFKAQSASEKLGREAGPYRVIYDEYKERKTAEGWGKSPGHRHNAATRYMEKRLVRDVWRQWRAAMDREIPKSDVSSATIEDLKDE